MRQYLSAIYVIARKDLVTEFRSREVLPTMIVLGMLITWIFRLVGESGLIPQAGMAAAALWIAFLFAGLMAQERCFATEEKQHCLAGLMLCPIDPGVIYLAKFGANMVILLIFEIVVVPAIGLGFGVRLRVSWWGFTALLLLGNGAISGVGTLFSALVHVARARGALLNVLVLVILLPAMIPATLALLLSFGALDGGAGGTGALALAGNFSTALSYLLVFDVLVITLSWLLFGFLLRE